MLRFSFPALVYFFLVFADAQQHDSIPYIGGTYGVTGVFSNTVSGAKVPVAGGGSVTNSSSSYDPAFDRSTIGSVAFGYGFEEFRAEFEGFYALKTIPQLNNNDFYFNTSTTSTGSYSKFTNGGVRYASLMMNGYYDMVASDVFAPYIGGGIGISRTEYFYGTNSDPTAKFGAAMQMKAGVSLAASTRFIPYVGCRLLYLMENELLIKSDDVAVTTDIKIKPSYITYSIEGGIVIPFIS